MKRREKAALLDTNVVLRFLLADDPEQSRRAHLLMRRLEEGKAVAELSDLVLAELAWVLEKSASVPRPEIVARLSALLLFSGMRHPNRVAALEALRRYRETNCDIVDCLLAARAHARATKVWSFDADFKKLGCLWEEPN